MRATEDVTAPEADPSPSPTKGSARDTVIAVAAASAVALIFFTIKRSRDLKAGEAQYIGLVKEVAAEVGIPASVLAAVITNESAWRNDKSIDSRCGVNCVSRYEPRINECSIGLAQTLVSTAKSVGVTGNLCDPRTSLRAGALYLKKMYERFNDWHKVFLAYNAGPGRVNNPPLTTMAYATRADYNAGDYRNQGLSGLRLFGPRHQFTNYI